MVLKSGLQVMLVGALVASLSTVADAAKLRRHGNVQRVVAVTGLAASHDMVRQGGRLCFADHYHYGSSLGQNNQRAAQAAAAESWAQFVNFEYGGEWDRYSVAAGKDMKCSQSSAGWGCEVSARPCR